MAVPPVARMTLVFGEVMKASISGMEGSSSIWITPAGAPAASAAAARMRAARTEVSQTAGCGEITSALRVISARITL